MSQKRPAPHSTSPPLWRSPRSSWPNSPATHRSNLRGGGDPSSEDGSQESSSVRSYGEWPQPVQRSLGVHSILNPPTSQPSSGGAAAPSMGNSPMGGLGRMSHTTTHYGTSPAQRPLLFQGHGVPIQQEISRPSGEALAATGTKPAMGSPNSIQPLSALGGPRRYLTPRSPRVSAISQGPPPGPGNVQPQLYPMSSLTGQGRPARDSVSGSPPDHSVQPFQRPTAALGSGNQMAGNISRSNTPSRSMSQHMLGQAHPSMQDSSRPPELMDRSHRPHGLPPSPYATSVPPTGRGFPTLASPDSRWSPLSAGQQGGRGSSMPEEQSTLVFATPGGEPVTFTIDKTNGSRQADEKRQRNAGASARFRQRKKDKDMQKEAAIEKLQAHNRDLERQIQELKLERERYRADRDRLRDVVYRTPNISELAYQGPPSPSARPAEPFASRSMLETGPPHQQQSLVSATYGEMDASTGERAPRRRRTNSRTEYDSTPYSNPLPPPSYSLPTSQPGTPLAGSRLERLPPLRLDRGPGVPTTSGPTSNPSVQGYSPIKREHYETGWAARPTGPFP
ncbi:hypothetical protein PFICI_05333 [Pestalotiopsis fici W106-1]|uniref:BZIP domain-containing protein n=1 Tax=Pestalotiopsis fici (strain W106-1 / CGMCC3.15140) TaxID=1229662 RepID=W3XDG3_PESFW|nr:uncharacterized protein PFICI_05333 [Pestalotiopsis fici W106-1]ETS83457.1 hypothetical protein PFICI_05333 [Pestalotiopsis fici W106-1]